MTSFIKCLEVHKYAPEMNRVHFKNGASYKCPHITEIRQVKEKLFKPAKTFVKSALLEAKYEHHPQEITPVGGTFNSYKDLLKAISIFKDRHNLEDIKVNVRIRSKYK